jgi:protease IV
MKIATRLALLAVLSLVLTAHAAEEKKDSTTDKAKSKVTLATFNFDEAYPEGPGQPGIFGELQPSLAKIIERLDKAAADDKIFGIFIHLEETDLGRGRVDELRAAIQRVRKAGKKVYAELQEASGPSYLVATACDEIVMPPVSMLTVSGVRMEVTYFKNLFEKLGIKADMLQVGDFKGAAEPFTRENMSPEFRKQTEVVIDDYYNQLVNCISTERKLDKGKVKDIVDEGLFTAARAKEVGLIDHVCYSDEFRSQLAAKQGVNEVALVEDYGKKQIDESEFSGFAGVVKMFELLAGVEPRGRISANQRIAVVYAVGPINTGSSREGLLSSALGSDTIVKALREAEKDSKVVAIVLRVDSPGGSALASDLMWREITRIKAKKPVVASMGDIAASGGYYISMGCTKIFAEPGTLTGSIGVVSGKLAMKDMFGKIGITTDTISRGKNSGWMSALEPFTPSEREVVMAMMKDCYKQFTEKAAQGRNMDLKDLEKLAGGKLYSGIMAKEAKLIDELGTLDDAVAEAKRLAGLKDEDKTDRLILPKPRSFLEGLLGSPVSAQVKLAAAQGVATAVTGSPGSVIAEQFGSLDAMVRLFHEPVVFVMPYHVRIK